MNMVIHSVGGHLEIEITGGEIVLKALTMGQE